MENLITTFHIDARLLIAQVINFVIVFIVLYVFGIRPLMKLVKSRSASIQQGLSDAEKNAQILSVTEEESARIIAEARREASEIMSSAKNDAEYKRALLMEETRTDIANMLEKSKIQLDLEKNKIIEEAHSDIVNLVMVVTRKVIGDSINPAVNSTFIEKAIKEL